MGLGDGAPERWRTWRVLRVAGWRARRWWASLEFALARRFGLATREDRRFFLLIPLTGVLAGVLGVVVGRLIGGVEALLWGSGRPLELLAAGLPPWRVLAAPLAGGLVVAVVAWLARESLSGGGMSLLIESVALRRGSVPARPVLWRAAAAVATVGSGGSLGREGPMIRLGAMIASRLGARLGLSAHRVRILVGCGAAAGFAAAYNVPVGGAVFAMEVILGNFALEIFGPIVVSSVISTLIVRAVEGNVPLYPAAVYELVSGWEILSFAGLGIVGALASIAYVFGVRAGTGAFRRLRWMPLPVKPILGMALLAGLALAVPQVLDGGHYTIAQALDGNLPLLALLAFAAAKLLATALTAGSGCAGGLFTPALFFGALVGGAYGDGIHHFFPHITGGSGAYALVGMAAIVAGTSHAPISSILILFEFTGNYNLILPLMIASILSSLVSKRLYRYSIYKEPLRAKGLDADFRMEEAALAGLQVSDLARQDAMVLRPADDYASVVERFLKTRRQRLFVVDRNGRLKGAVSLHDIKHTLEEPESVRGVVAHDLVAPVGDVLYDDDPLTRVAQVFGASDHERIPVIGREDGRYQGMISKRDLLAVYAQEVLGRPALLATFVSGQETEASKDYVELPPDFAVRALPLPEQLEGKTLAEARLPQALGVRVLALIRGEERLIPEASTRLLRGDQLVVLGLVSALAVMGAAAREEVEGPAGREGG